MLRQLLGIVLLAAVLAACGGYSDTSGSSSTGATGTATTPPTDDVTLGDLPSLNALVVVAQPTSLPAQSRCLDLEPFEIESPEDDTEAENWRNLGIIQALRTDCDDDDNVINDAGFYELSTDAQARLAFEQEIAPFADNNERVAPSPVPLPEGAVCLLRTEADPGTNTGGENIGAFRCVYHDGRFVVVVDGVDSDTATIINAAPETLAIMLRWAVDAARTANP